MTRIQPFKSLSVPRIAVIVLFVLLGAVLLMTILNLTSLQLRIALLVIILLTGICVRRNIWQSYLLLIILYPLIPSIPQQFHLPVIEYTEFLFFSFSFWWSLEKIREKAPVIPKLEKISGPVAWLVGILFLSACIAVLRDNLILTKVFVLKLKSLSSFLVPWPAGNGLYSIQTWLHFAEGSLFLWITSNLVDRRERLVLTVKAMLVSAGIVSLFGIYQFVFRYQLLTYWLKENPNLTRIHSTFDDPNALGTYLASLFCIGIFPLIAGLRKKWIFGGILLLILIALGMTASRAALGATVMAFLFIPIVVVRMNVSTLSAIRGKLKILGTIGLFFLAVIFLLIVAAFIVDYRDPQPKSLVEVVLYTFNPSLPLNDVLKGRLGLWESALMVFRDFPLLGCGPGMSPKFLHDYPRNALTGAKFENVHNYFLQLLAESGLTGFLLFALILFQIARTGIRNLRFGEEGAVRLGLLSGWIAFLLTSLTGHPLLLPKMQFLFWGISGLILSIPALPLQAKKTKQSFHKLRGVRIAIGTILILIVAVEIRSTLRSRNLDVYEYGYFGFEQDSKGTFFRWTKQEGISILTARGKVLELSLRRPLSKNQREPSSIQIYINERILDTVVVRNENWNSREYYLPEIAPGERILLRIVPDTTLRPRDFGSQGNRRLGVAIQNFQWKCSLERENSGTYEQENSNGRVFRWTTRQASFDLEREGSRLIFDALPNSSVLHDPLNAEFYWNDKLIQNIEMNNHAWLTMSLPIPGEDSKSGVLTVRVSNTWNPRRMSESSDLRELGIALSPFRWEGPVKLQSSSKLELPLLDRSVIGILNDDSQPRRLVLYKIKDPGITNPGLWKDKILLSENAGLLQGWNQSDSLQYKIYPQESDDPEYGLFVNDSLTRKIASPSGDYVLKLTARAKYGGLEPPLLKIAWDQRILGGQPLVSAKWRDYFFEVHSVPSGKHKITATFLNDFFDPAKGIDRNVYIQELSAWQLSNSGISRFKTDKAEWSYLRNFDAKPIDLPASGLQLSGNANYEFEKYFSPGLVTLFIRAKVQPGSEKNPKVAVQIDHTYSGSWNVDSEDTREYSMDLPLAGPRKITINLENPDPNHGIQIEQIRMQYQPAVLVAEPIHDFLFPECNCYTLKPKL